MKSELERLDEGMYVHPHMFSVCSEEATCLSLEKNVHAYHEQRIGKRFSSGLSGQSK
jgi:hypothetical protein